VTGTITYDGKPLTGGLVTFLDQNERAHQGNISAEGKYTIPDVPVGDVKIAVNTTFEPPNIPRGGQGAPPKGMKWQPPKGVLPEGVNIGGFSPPDASSKSQHFPERFTNPDKSGLRYTVTPGQQNHNIDL